MLEEVTLLEVVTLLEMVTLPRMVTLAEGGDSARGGDDPARGGGDPARGGDFARVVTPLEDVTLLEEVTLLEVAGRTLEEVTLLEVVDATRGGDVWLRGEVTLPGGDVLEEVICSGGDASRGGDSNSEVVTLLEEVTLLDGGDSARRNARGVTLFELADVALLEEVTLLEGGDFAPSGERLLEGGDDARGGDAAGTVVELCLELEEVTLPRGGERSAAQEVTLHCEVVTLASREGALLLGVVTLLEVGRGSRRLTLLRGGDATREVTCSRWVTLLEVVTRRSRVVDASFLCWSDAARVVNAGSRRKVTLVEVVTLTRGGDAAEEVTPARGWLTLLGGGDFARGGDCCFEVGDDARGGDAAGVVTFASTVVDAARGGDATRKVTSNSYVLTCSRGGACLEEGNSARGGDDAREVTLLEVVTLPRNW
nr:hypothetical protein Iba_chr13eCG10150 [Ipomoea batatas]